MLDFSKNKIILIHLTAKLVVLWKNPSGFVWMKTVESFWNHQLSKHGTHQFSTGTLRCPRCACASWVSLMSVCRALPVSRRQHKAPTSAFPKQKQRETPWTYMNFTCEIFKNKTWSDSESTWNIMKCQKKHGCFFLSDCTHNFCWASKPWVFYKSLALHWDHHPQKPLVKDRASITSRRFWPPKIGATLCKGWCEVGWKKTHERKGCVICPGYRLRCVKMWNTGSSKKYYQIARLYLGVWAGSGEKKKVIWSYTPWN